MAMYLIQNPGNTAIQTEVWRLSLDEAKAAQQHLNCTKGGYWHATLVRPYRRSQRAKMDVVRVYTAGFSSGELSNAIYAAGYSVEQAA